MDLGHSRILAMHHKYAINALDDLVENANTPLSKEVGKPIGSVNVLSVHTREESKDEEIFPKQQLEAAG